LLLERDCRRDQEHGRVQAALGSLMITSLDLLRWRRVGVFSPLRCKPHCGL